MKTSPLPLLAVRAIVLVALAAAPEAFAASPRIVNGALTFDYPSVGALLAASESRPGRYDGICTGTLIGCRTFLTAAHCLCPRDRLDFTACTNAGLTDPSTLRVYLPHGGLLEVEQVAIHPSYSFTEAGDVAVVRLAAPVSGIAPSALNDIGRPPHGTLGAIVGYGSAGGGPAFRLADFGVKREGRVTTGMCSEAVSAANHVCWTFLGEGASTCIGDSGGPLFVDLGDGLVLAGNVSGDESPDCSAPDPVFTSDVFVNREWILAQLGDDTPPCGDLDLVGNPRVDAVGYSGDLSNTSVSLRFELAARPGTRELRVGMNGQQAINEGFFRTTNDFDLFVRYGEPPSTSDHDCADQTDGVFGFCRFEEPAEGTWHILVTRFDGTGTAQVTATAFDSTLAGDANCDDHVTAADLTALAWLVANDEKDPCDRADVDGNGILDAADLRLIEQLIFEP